MLCYGLLNDDKEYIEAIKEASYWGLGDYLRKLFAMILISNSISRPEHVGEETCRLLSDDILYNERRLCKNPSCLLNLIQFVFKL